MGKKHFVDASKHWANLMRQAQNGRKAEARVVEIEVAETLIMGGFSRSLPESMLVRDLSGQIWEVPETTGGLVSRYNVRRGMRLRLVVAQGGGTKAFPLTPEIE